MGACGLGFGGVGGGALALELVGAVEDFLPPGFVMKVPIDGFAEAGGVVLLGRPAKFVTDLRGIDGVAEVVAGAVGDEGDQVLGGLEC